jgi:hypothetical protein
MNSVQMCGSNGYSDAINYSLINLLLPLPWDDVHIFVIIEKEITKSDK